MKKLLSTILILFLCLGIYSCSNKSDEDDLKESTTTDNDTTTDTTAPILAEVTVVTTPTTDTTPAYTFSSTEAGTITYGASCTSSTTSASSGNNAITFSTLSDGTYDNCTVMVTDNASNSSIPLEITRFIVRDFSISSSASDNATVTFGQSYQYQLNTGGTYSDTITYSLSNEPDNMTISSSGLVEWTPDNGSDITNYDNGTTNSPHTITITLTTASGYVLTETYDLTVTGTCVSGNVMAIWSGDQRSSTDSSKLLGNVTAYTDNATSGDVCGNGNNQSSGNDCTAYNNYDLRSASLHLTHGPTASATKGSIFFYNQYDNTSNLYLFFFFGDAGNSNANTVKLDVLSSNNSSSDVVKVSDDGTETSRVSQSESSGLYTSSYKSRHSYNGSHSDGAVIGPYTGTDFKILVDVGGTSSIDSETLTLGNLDSFKYFSKDGSSFALGGDNVSVDNFTIGYKTTVSCE